MTLAVASFSKDEIALIKQTILTPGAMVECPRCGTLLRSDSCLATEAHMPKVLWVSCEACKCGLLIHDLPTDRDRRDNPETLLPRFGLDDGQT